MYTAKPVEGQIYSNRIRKNLQRIMESRGMPGTGGLPHLTAAGLYKFMTGGCDITVTRAQLVADDLGITLQELLQYAED